MSSDHLEKLNKVSSSRGDTSPYSQSHCGHWDLWLFWWEFRRTVNVEIGQLMLKLDS